MKNDKYEFSRGSSHGDKNSGLGGNFVKNSHSSISISQSKRKKKDIFTYGICLLLSLVLWIYVMNVGITDYEQSVSVAVQFEGELDEQYMIYPEIEDTVAVKLKGKKTDILQSPTALIKAYIDLGSIRSVGKQNLSVKIEKMEGVSASVENISPVSLSLNICERISKTVRIDADISNIPKVSGYIYTASVGEASVEISGPDELINKIGSVKAVCKLSSAVTSTTEVSNVSLEFYDASGNVISDSDMKYITASVNSVSVTINVMSDM